MIEGEPIYIGFSDYGKYVHQIISEERLPDGSPYLHGYDVNYSRIYGCHLVYNSGDMSMQEPLYWSRDLLSEEWQHAEHTRLPEIPPEFLEDGSFLIWLESHAIEEEYGIVYCPRCKDYFSEEEGSPCLHIWYCHECGHYSKPGERCRHRRRAA